MFLYIAYISSFILYIFFLYQARQCILYLSDKYEVALDVNKKTICFIIAACTTQLKNCKRFCKFNTILINVSEN